MGSTDSSGIALSVHNAHGALNIVHTRLPFRYGNARLVACPHLVVKAEVHADGRRAEAVAADNLPPLWFDKDASKSYPQQIDEQIRVVRWALEPLEGATGSGFRLWQEVQAHVYAKVRAAGWPDLLAAFGVSMAERLMWDGLGRVLGRGFHEMVRCNLFGVDLAALDPSLKGVDISDVIPQGPASTVWARHTVGLADPIYDREIEPGDAVLDGLPQSLAACLAFYGYRFIKIKLSNNLESDLERLAQITEVMLEAEAAQGQGVTIRCTLDGNEQYSEVAELEELVAKMAEHERVRRMGERILFFEQPFARDRALNSEGLRGFAVFTQRFPVIIDESDATVQSYSEALKLGYRGTSHKNCKGIVKSLLNLGRHRVHEREGGLGLIMSGEDLTNLGPVALVQDLAVAAALGIEHVERNGHHFFQGMRHVAPQDADAALERHGRLFERRGEIRTVCIRNGQMDARGLTGPGLGDAVIPNVATWSGWEDFDAATLM